MGGDGAKKGEGERENTIQNGVSKQMREGGREGMCSKQKTKSKIITTDVSG